MAVIGEAVQPLVQAKLSVLGVPEATQTRLAALVLQAASEPEQAKAVFAAALPLVQGKPTMSAVEALLLAVLRLDPKNKDFHNSKLQAQALVFLQEAGWWPKAGNCVLVKDSQGQLMYGEVEAEEEDGRFSVRYDVGRYENMELSGVVAQKTKNGLYLWTHDTSDDRRVYKQQGGSGFLYHYPGGGGGIWMIGNAVGKSACSMKVAGEPAERPDQISGTWEEWDGKAWVAAADVAVEARANIGRGISASTVIVIDKQKAAAAASTSSGLAAVAATAAAAAVAV
jgi:hypothetical protein